MRSWMWLGSRAYRTSALGISRLPSNNSLREPASFLSSLASLPRVDAASALSEADTKRFAEDGATRAKARPQGFILGGCEGCNGSVAEGKELRSDT